MGGGPARDERDEGGELSNEWARVLMMVVSLVLLTS